MATVVASGGCTPEQRRQICLLKGVAPEDIDPATGYDISDRAYGTVRESWRDWASSIGLSEYYDLPRYRKTVALWHKFRPDLCSADAWWFDGIEIEWH
ncbi:hypothetical protein DMA15_03890 [Streptomyces sp. WAC 01529]|nr:hypothetical protein DMA15_03890 [Streptomyces sp. WAC 01529]